jgi:diguanylate cyclase (GGDEF)-like protein
MRIGSPVPFADFVPHHQPLSQIPGTPFVVLLLLALFTAPLAAQIASREALVQGIERACALSAAERNLRITHPPEGDRNTEIFLRFARLQSSLAAKNTTAAAADAQRILAAASALDDPTSLRLVYSELADLLAGSSRSQIAERERLESLNLLHQEQLRAAVAEQRRKDQQITELRAQSQLAAAEKLRQQLADAQRNQQFQLDYLTRRSQLKNVLTVLLFACLLLTVALAWSLWRVNIARQQQALEDPLTGLKNRRFLSPFMEHETQRLRRSGLTALVLMADVDHFKKLNDRYGHDAGDEALVQLAEALSHCVRDSDTVARWGGEEFVIVCPQSTEEHAKVICNRIRHHLGQTPIHFPGKPPLHLTLSIGAALFSPATGNEHWEGALARADQALYFVKRNGRDGWSLAASAPGGEPSRSQATGI